MIPALDKKRRTLKTSNGKFVKEVNTEVEEEHQIDMIDDSTPAADEACDVSNAPTVYTYDTKGVRIRTAEFRPGDYSIYQRSQDPYAFGASVKNELILNQGINSSVQRIVDGAKAYKIPQKDKKYSIETYKKYNYLYPKFFVSSMPNPATNNRTFVLQVNHVETGYALNDDALSKFTAFANTAISNEIANATA